jgi:hypothetical protein
MISYPPPPIAEVTINAMQQLVDAGASEAELVAAMRKPASVLGQADWAAAWAEAQAHWKL